MPVQQSSWSTPTNQMPQYQPPHGRKWENRQMAQWRRINFPMRKPQLNRGIQILLPQLIAAFQRTTYTQPIRVEHKVSVEDERADKDLRKEICTSDPWYLVNGFETRSNCGQGSWNNSLVYSNQRKRHAEWTRFELWVFSVPLSYNAPEHCPKSPSAKQGSWYFFMKIFSRLDFSWGHGRDCWRMLYQRPYLSIFSECIQYIGKYGRWKLHGRCLNYWFQRYSLHALLPSLWDFARP